MKAFNPSNYQARFNYAMRRAEMVAGVPAGTYQIILDDLLCDTSYSAEHWPDLPDYAEAELNRIMSPSFLQKAERGPRTSLNHKRKF